MISPRVGAALIQRRIGMQWAAKDETAPARALSLLPAGAAAAPHRQIVIASPEGTRQAGGPKRRHMKATTMVTMTQDGAEAGDGSPSRLIDGRIRELGDWRGEMLARVRALIRQADPEVVEEWKWRGVPVWSHAGIICTGETYRNVVKMTFAKGASLEDPSRLFNASLEGNTRRAVDLHEGDEVNEEALIALVRAAVALNESTAAARRRT
jgi:hypothetical protein